MDAALARDIDELDRVEQANPAAMFWLTPPGVGRWGASDWQRAVMNDPSMRVLVRKGNKVGGSCLASCAIKAYLDGWHPTWHRPSRPVDILYVAADLDTTYKKDVSRRLREFFTDADLSDRCTFDRARGFMVSGGRGIETSAGDIVTFVSGTQAALALSGGSSDVILVNEPPRQSAWGEVVRAAAEWGAPILVNFTPLPPESLVGGDDLSWFRKQIEASGWSEHVVPLRYETAPHRTHESIDQQILDMFPWERPQRRDAAWEGPAPLRSIANWDDTQTWHGEEWSDLPGADGEIRLGLWADHGEIGGHEVVALGAWQGRGRDSTVWFVDEYQSPERTTIAMDAAAILRMLERRGLTYEQIDEAVGDVNSAGKSALTSVNQEMSRELRVQSGMKGPTFRNAAKGPGSVQMGVRILDNALGEKRVWVHVRCEGLRRAMRRWQGADDEFKHCFVRGTLIATPDGPRAIESFVGAPGLVYCWDGSGLVGAVAHGLAQGRKVVGSFAGEACTADHEWYVETGEKVRADECSVPLMLYDTGHGTPRRLEYYLPDIPWSPLLQGPGRLLPLNEDEQGEGEGRSDLPPQGRVSSEHRRVAGWQEVARPPQGRRQGQQQAGEPGTPERQDSRSQALDAGAGGCMAGEPAGYGDSSVEGVARFRGGVEVALGEHEEDVGGSADADLDLLRVRRTVRGQGHGQGAAGLLREHLQDADLSTDSERPCSVREGCSEVPGEVEVYDLSVHHPGHNFLLQSGFVVSNCIDQARYGAVPHLDPRKTTGPRRIARG